MSNLKRTLIAAAVVALAASACGTKDGTNVPAPSEASAAPETTAPPETTVKRSGKEAFCSTIEDNLELLKETDPASSGEEIDQFVAVVAELAELAPSEVKDDAQVLAEALQPVGDAPEDEKEGLLQDVFADAETSDAAERFAEYVDDECGISLSGDTTGTTTKGSTGTAKPSTERGSADAEAAMNIRSMKQWLTENAAGEAWYPNLIGWGVGQTDNFWRLTADLSESATTDDAIAVCRALQRYASEKVTADDQVAIEINGPDGELVHLDGLDSTCQAS